MVKRGVDYPRAYAKLRDYVKSLSEEDFEEQVKQVTMIDVFRYLLATGLSLEQQELIAAKVEELRQ
jgi:hypothetical protein